MPTVTDNVGLDGSDTLTNVEFLQFADTATSGAPTGVTAVGGVARATVGWIAPRPAPRALQVVTSYLVEATNAATGAVATFPAGAAATTLDVALAAGSYTFRVQAANAAATPPAGPWSLSTGAVPVTDITPGAPSIGTATAGNTTATVNWSAPAPNGGSPITSYSVEVTAAGVVQPTVLTAGPTATSLVVTGLTNGTA